MVFMSFRSGPAQPFQERGRESSSIPAIISEAGNRRRQQVRGARRIVGQPVLVSELLPLEGDELVKRQHPDQPDILLWRNKPPPAVYVGGSVRKSRNQPKTHPDRLANRRKPFGKAQCR